MISEQTIFSKYSFDGDTQDNSIKAPRPRPMESEELLPEFKLEDPSISEQFNFSLVLQEKKKVCHQRKGSLDMNYSILGFIDRKIREKSRQRIMSEQISHYKI